MAKAAILTNNDEAQTVLFITGAGQGVGLATTIEAVKRGYHVVGATSLGTKGATRIRRAGGTPIYPDLSRESALYSALQMAKADIIINAAPQALNGIPQRLINYNNALPFFQEATEALIGAAGRADIQRVIHLSAAMVYGDTHHEAVDENGHLDLSNPLSAALHQMEEAVLDGGLPGYVLRTGYIFGTHKGSADTAQALRAGKAVPSGTHPTSWANEQDVAEVILRLVALDNDEHANTIYNIANDEQLSPDDFMTVFGEAYGTGIPATLSGWREQRHLSAFQRELMNMSTLVDTSKARRELGWEPQGSIASGLDKMLLLWRGEKAARSLKSSDNKYTGREIITT